MTGTYCVYDCEVIEYNGQKAIISDEDFKAFQNKFVTDSKFIYLKIDQVYIPVFPSSTIPLHTVAITAEQKEEHDIETPAKNAFVADPEMIEWL